MRVWEHFFNEESYLASPHHCLFMVFLQTLTDVILNLQSNFNYLHGGLITNNLKSNTFIPEGVCCFSCFIRGNKFP